MTNKKTCTSPLGMVCRSPGCPVHGKKTCTCDPENEAGTVSIGCPEHDFGFAFNGLRGYEGTVHEAAAVLRPAQRVEPLPTPAKLPQITLKLSARDLLVSAALLIPDQPTPEQWHTIKNAIGELLKASENATRS